MNRHQRRAEEKHKKNLAKKLEAEKILMEFESPPDALQVHGPIVITDLGIVQPYEDLLIKAGKPVPARTPCRFLIDTGASNCLVKHEVAERAGLKLINANAPVHGVGVDTTGKVYLGRIWFGMRSKIHAETTHQIFVDAQILSGTLANAQAFDGIIGRDVLRHFELTYVGGTGKFSLQYIRPKK